MLKSLIKIALSVLIIGYLISLADPEQVAALIADARAEYVVLAGLIILFGPFAQAFRWMLIVRALGNAFPYTAALANVYVGILFNQVLPSSIGGDAVRMWRLYKSGTPLNIAVNSVLLDRISALFALGIMVGLCTPAMYASYGNRPEFIAAPILVAGIAFAFVCMLTFDRLPQRWRKWRPINVLSRLSTASRIIFLRPSTATSTVLLSFLTHGTGIVSVFLIARSLSLDLRLLDCLLLVPPVILLSVLPVSVAGWGIREGAMISALAIVGVGYDAAFTVSVMFGLGIMIAGIPGAFLWITSPSRNEDDVPDSAVLDDAIADMPEPETSGEKSG